MPLHTIPLCSFTYVGDNLSSATFKCDTREDISKNKTKLFYKKNETEINKIDIKSFYGSTNEIDKYSGKDIIINANNEVYKNIEISLDKTNKLISKSTAKELNFIEKEIIKENLSALNCNDVDINMLKAKNLLDTHCLGLFKDVSLKQFVRDSKIELSNSDYTINVENYNKSKYITIEFSTGLDLDFLKGMSINSSINIDVTRKQELTKTSATYLDKNKEKGLGIIKNNRYLDKYTIRSMNIKNNILNVNRVDIKKADILTSIYLDRENEKGLRQITNSNLVYKINNFRLNKYNYTNIEKDNIKNIVKSIDTKLFYTNTLKRISKINNILELNKDTIIRLSKCDSINLNKHKIIEIFKNNSNSLQKYMSFKNIFKGNTLGFNKDELKIDNRIEIKGLNKEILINKYNELKGLNKFRIDIYLPYTTTDLEVIQRWWVLGAIEPYDKKILPYDYNYLKKALSINRKDREHGWLVEKNKHPISFMPYLEDLQGIDLGYGLEEINLSIEIMIDMVNIVGMIVQHSASQFANASGHESIEFIMEVLLDWLNLDTTVQEMNLKGSREHYLRTYRWIRWEAEKVWFMADKDHTQDKMIGIKYAGMLFANLIDYMKYHHFDIVPLWRNLKYMDIERLFNRTLTNGDLIGSLDKLKSKRHYYIETQKF
ncbi:hypothetical protein [Hathewaya massiliensis]|uniref:hypothetical protein n=1 Tax=Hathewaya massiliensis TaxID=1964382 RepID=UPI001157ADA2|nr:hypothetical protein [Hathewaya massiliensis]